jgi:WD domain, G-beta repeat
MSLLNLPEDLNMKTLIALLTLTLILCVWSGDRVAVRGQQTPDPPTTQPPAAGRSFGGTEVRVAEFSPDGKRVLVTSQDGTVRIWDAQTGQALAPGTNGTIQVWDVASGKPVLPRYHADTPDKMPMIGRDNFKTLQDQIDALEKRVQELEKKAATSGR